MWAKKQLLASLLYNKNINIIRRAQNRLDIIIKNYGSYKYLQNIITINKFKKETR